MRRLARVGSVLVALSACSTSAASERAETIPPLNITAPAADPTTGLNDVLEWHRAEDLDRWLTARERADTARQEAEKRATAARLRAEKVNRSRAARSSPAPASPATAGELELLGSFRATCYQLTGRTASGLPAGPGRIAVDPRVIPLGTRLFVEGYGDAVAADTGGAIKGARIDVWRASCAGYPNPTVAVYRRP